MISIEIKQLKREIISLESELSRAKSILSEKCNEIIKVIYDQMNDLGSEISAYLEDKIHLPFFNVNNCYIKYTYSENEIICTTNPLYNSTWHGDSFSLKWEWLYDIDTLYKFIQDEVDKYHRTKKDKLSKVDSAEYKQYLQLKSKYENLV